MNGGSDLMYEIDSNAIFSCLVEHSPAPSRASTPYIDMQSGILYDARS